MGGGVSTSFGGPGSRLRSGQLRFESHLQLDGSRRFTVEVYDQLVTTSGERVARGLVEPSAYMFIEPIAAILALYKADNAVPTYHWCSECRCLAGITPKRQIMRCIVCRRNIETSRGLHAESLARLATLFKLYRCALCDSFFLIDEVARGIRETAASAAWLQEYANKSPYSREGVQGAPGPVGPAGPVGPRGPDLCPCCLTYLNKAPWGKSGYLEPVRTS